MGFNSGFKGLILEKISNCSEWTVVERSRGSSLVSAEAPLTAYLPPVGSFRLLSEGCQSPFTWGQTEGGLDLI